MRVQKTIMLAAFCCFSFVCPAEAAKKTPFSGSWISTQFTNGKEFHLKLQQLAQDLIGWEGRLPPSSEELAPDLKGTIKGKIAEVEVSHRRGYKAHARLTLQGSKLVWQLLDADSRSNRYFPLASTLHRRDEDSTAETVQAAQKTGDQMLWDILSHADSLDNGTIGEAAAPSTYFAAYKALLSHGAKPDDPALQATLKCSSPAGRIYAACILWESDHKSGLEAFKELAADQSAVSYKSGCEVFPSTVAEVARSFIEKGGYLDFPCKKY